MENNEGYKLAPITDKQAVNVARNTLHSLINASGMGPTDTILRSLHDSAQPKDSDIRAAMKVLDDLLQVLPRDWTVPKEA
jgi:hypothetical protein